MKKLTTNELTTAAADLQFVDAETALRWALDVYGNDVAIASSFSREDCAVIDMAVKLDARARVFALDTGRLHDETYMTADRIHDRYGIRVEWYFPQREAVEELVNTEGMFSFRASLENRHACCGIRKLEPLGRVLGRLGAWVTGLRAEQSVTRTDMRVLEVDEAHGGIAKLNPIISWGEAQLDEYVKANNVPVHPLHLQGFPSIGCAPCTRAIAEGEHPRAGRWWWEDPENKECGLHQNRR